MDLLRPLLDPKFIVTLALIGCATALAWARIIDGAAWIGSELADADVRSRRHAAGGHELSMPPGAFAGLMRLLLTRLEGISDNPSLGKVLRERADLCDEERSPK